MKDLKSYFNLTSDISDKNDWDKAFEISLEISSKAAHSKPVTSLVEMGSKMLLTTSILMASQTDYPDLLTVRILLLLCNLKARLKNAQQQGKLITTSIEIANGFQFFIDCPDLKITPAILLKTINALDNYLSRLELPLTEWDFITREEYLEQILPMPIKPEFGTTVLLSA